ncbi:gp16 family protein [Paracoccus sp. (in: a-proteobacteria)]|uniref:gp16 family protein n=1 Tax=Paracoccus sp. TaxID=267 RepID=UPI0026E0F612|nr:regulatory protein GemA [Paracoccus sp. (in: a-proteobacteria)]MDO5648371.1 regulatory protein GemA [Paracoccus sp. (in: a-proteobacteria)]
MNANAIINIAKSQMGLDEATYRALLARVTGKDSLRAMNDREKRAVIDELKRRGFRVQAKGKTLPASTKAYARKIHALWRSCYQLDIVQDGSRAALRAFCRNMTQPGQANIATDPDLMTYAQAQPVIEALKKMEARGKAKAGRG